MKNPTKIFAEARKKARNSSGKSANDRDFPQFFFSMEKHELYPGNCMGKIRLKLEIIQKTYDYVACAIGRLLGNSRSNRKDILDKAS